MKRGVFIFDGSLQWGWGVLQILNVNVYRVASPPGGGGYNKSPPITAQYSCRHGDSASVWNPRNKDIVTSFHEDGLTVRSHLTSPRRVGKMSQFVKKIRTVFCCCFNSER